MNLSSCKIKFSLIKNYNKILKKYLCVYPAAAAYLTCTKHFAGKDTDFFFNFARKFVNSLIQNSPDKALREYQFMLSLLDFKYHKTH